MRIKWYVCVTNGIYMCIHTYSYVYNKGIYLFRKLGTSITDLFIIKQSLFSQGILLSLKIKPCDKEPGSLFFSWNYSRSHC